MTVNDFQFKLNIDDLNVFKLERFLQKSNLINKVNGFLDKLDQQQISLQEETEQNDELVEKHRPPLKIFEDFILSLSNSNKDGRILIENDCKQARYCI